MEDPDVAGFVRSTVENYVDCFECLAQQYRRPVETSPDARMRLLAEAVIIVERLVNPNMLQLTGELSLNMPEQRNAYETRQCLADCIFVGQQVMVVSLLLYQGRKWEVVMMALRYIHGPT